jgi:hypothetical protein
MPYSVSKNSNATFYFSNQSPGRLPVSWMWHRHLAHVYWHPTKSSCLMIMMQAVGSSTTAVRVYLTTGCHIPKDNNVSKLYNQHFHFIAITARYIKKKFSFFWGKIPSTIVKLKLKVACGTFSALQPVGRLYPCPPMSSPHSSPEAPCTT